ncbi:MAG TPA: lamin tail domain-containing protein, partial [Anaerolineales bacterium]
MHRSKILIRILFVFILLAGLLAGVFISTRASVNVAPLRQSATNVVISQVYGGGGNSGSPYQNDFVELFNPTDAPVSLNANWSVQYVAATGSFPSTGNNLTPLTSITLAPGHYYLLVMGANSIGGVNADQTGSTAMSATAGKVRLVDSDNQVVDLVGYGTTANEFEGGGPAPSPSNTKAD